MGKRRVGESDGFPLRGLGGVGRKEWKSGSKRAGELESNQEIEFFRIIL
jgi:hypothetical protein